MKYLILSKVIWYLSSEWYNARYLVPLSFLIYPSTLSKIIYKGFALNRVLYATS